MVEVSAAARTPTAVRAAHQGGGGRGKADGGGGAAREGRRRRGCASRQTAVLEVSVLQDGPMTTVCSINPPVDCFPNPQMSRYSYKSIESICVPLSSYMGIQTEITERMKAILIDWLTEVQHRLTLMSESVYLTVYIIDQYLSCENVPKRELQLVSISAMLIATKYEEIWAPLVKELLCISDNAFTREQVLRTEKAILNGVLPKVLLPTIRMAKI